MLHDQYLSALLWAEATSTTVYIQNRSPHVILDEKTSGDQVVTGEKPNISHLRIFKIPVYIHVPKEKRTAMEPLGKKRTFVGYSESSKAYII